MSNIVYLELKLSASVWLRQLGYQSLLTVCLSCEYGIKLHSLLVFHDLNYLVPRTDGNDLIQLNIG